MRRSRPFGGVAIFAALAAGVGAVSLLVAHGWILARLAADPSRERLVDWFEQAASGGMPGRGAGGAWRVLRRDDLAEINPSRCARSYACARLGRLNCPNVQTTYVCAFDLKDRAGATAVSALMISPNVLHDPASPAAWQRDTHVARSLAGAEADDALATLGYPVSARGAR